MKRVIDWTKRRVEKQQYSIAEAATAAGISEALLMLWIETKKVTPSIDMNMQHPLMNRGQRTKWVLIFTREDVLRLRAMVEDAAIQKANAEAHHKPGTHYTVQELAALWALSADTIREMFKDEPNVLKITPLTHAKKSRKKKYAPRRQPPTVLRIPESVADRVARRYSNPAGA